MAQPIPNIDFATVNQAYNNYNLEVNGRLNQYNSRVLAGGYYRQALDNTTLSKIRQGKGVLIGGQIRNVPLNALIGVGGCGSTEDSCGKCCPPVPGQPTTYVDGERRPPFQ